MGNRPDYRIAVLNKEDDRYKGQIGAAWINPDGRISLVFNPFVVVPVGPQYLISLFPEDYSAEASEDIPF